VFFQANFKFFSAINIKGKARYMSSKNKAACIFWKAKDIRRMAKKREKKNKTPIFTDFFNMTEASLRLFQC